MLIKCLGGYQVADETISLSTYLHFIYINSYNVYTNVTLNTYSFFIEYTL